MKQAPTTPDLKKMFKEPKKYTKGFVAATPPLIVPFPPVKQDITPELREVFVEPRDYVEVCRIDLVFVLLFYCFIVFLCLKELLLRVIFFHITIFRTNSLLLRLCT